MHLRFDSASASLISCFRCSALSMIITSTVLPFVRILTAPSFSPFCFAPPPAPPLVHVTRHVVRDRELRVLEHY